MKVVFDSAQAAGAFAALVSITQQLPSKNQNICEIEASASRILIDKANTLRAGLLSIAKQTDQLKNPDAIISTASTGNIDRLSKYAQCFQGTSTGDNPRFVRMFWELSKLEKTWNLFQSPVDSQVFWWARSSCTVVYFTSRW
ncbi:MAG: hypothetical protein WKF84_14635 [Pyrinomonadaceae bacterium]